MPAEFIMPCLPANGPYAFHRSDRFVVVNDATRVAVQGESAATHAIESARVLSEHNERNGHSARYVVVPLPSRLHNRGPREWSALLSPAP